MKKKIIILTIIIIAIYGGINLYKYIRIKTAKVEITLKEDLTINFNDTAKVSDYIESINGKIIDDYTIDTSEPGSKVIKFTFINDQGIKLNYSYNVEIIDVTEPVIWLSTSYRVAKGSKFDPSSILCGDDYDPEPNCYVEGNYNTDEVGEYPLIFRAVDSSGNMAIQEFMLKVYEPEKNIPSNTPSKVSRTNFSDVVRNYKTSNIKIGIDVSSWQKDIDFKKVKEAGVEFVIIRVGGTRGPNGEYFLDSKFIQNIKGAKENGIPVGLYFNSYAPSVEASINDANWVLDKIKDYEIDLPIGFDWEDWTSFNEYKLSFYNLSNISDSFLGRLEEEGYSGTLYSSKKYLEYIWFPTKYDVWLAHYTTDTDYNGKYRFWQLCENGKVDGISTNVDIDIMYY